MIKNQGEWLIRSSWLFLIHLPVDRCKECREKKSVAGHCHQIPVLRVPPYILAHASVDLL